MELGKPSRNILSSTVWRLTGASSRDVISGPVAGADVSVLRLRDDRVMIANCDPISLIPSLGPEDSARMSVYDVASDVATSGRPPRYVMFDLNLPPKVSDQTLREYWKAIDKACRELNLSILGGHTGRFQGCDYSVVGSATMWTFCRESEYLTSQMAQDADDLILTKTAAFGATAVLARAFPRTVRRFLGDQLFQKALDYFPRTNTVNDSLTAVSVGIHNRGVTAIHDVTEGGVLGALFELCTASNLGSTIDVDSIPISEETMLVSRLFHIDPLTSLGEGSLVIASRPEKTSRLIERLNLQGVCAEVVGTLSAKAKRIVKSDRHGTSSVRYPSRDPYWKAYWRAVRRGWS